MGRATARAPMEKPAVLNAPLFRQLIEQLDHRRRLVVLDLGAANTPMLSLLGQYRCLAEIADLASGDGIERLNGELPPEVLAKVAVSLLPKHTAGTEADVVFCWDLLNYLKPEAITALARAILARTRPGSRVHALIAYSEKSMPDHPARYVPTGDLKLVNRGPQQGEIASPRYSPEFLGRIMRGMEIEHARLLANGMQEFQLRVKR